MQLLRRRNTSRVHQGLDALEVGGRSHEEVAIAVAQLGVQLGQETVAGKEGGRGKYAIEQSLTHIVQLPLRHGKQLPVPSGEVAVPYLRLSGIAMER